MSIVKNFRMVILESPYDQWENPVVRNLFAHVAALKIHSYSQVYPYGIMPVDTYDYVGTHLLLCEERVGELIPVATYRSLTHAKCDMHRMKFPLTALLDSIGAKEHSAVMKTIVQSYFGQLDQLAYQSGWTIEPAYREDRALTAEIKSIMTALICRFSIESGVKEAVGGGAVRFKADRFFIHWGFVPFMGKNGPLPTVRAPSYFDEELNIIRCTSWSKEAQADGERWSDMWNARLHFKAVKESAVGLSRAA